MSTLTVGVGQQYLTIASAVAASNDGDVVQVQAGTYVNDFAEITHKITIEGVGGMAKLVATGPIPNGKAILITDTDVTLDHLDLSGATVKDGNGAGVRYQGGNLTMTNDYVHDNQNGILAGAVPTGNVTIKNSEFNHNGSGTGQTHNIYIGGVNNLTIDNSYIHGAVVGHEVKSRAASTTITNSRIGDGSTGNASYEIDLPNGGNALIQNNTIEKGPNAQNSNMISYGEEGDLYGAADALKVVGNTLLNDKSSSVNGVMNYLTTAANVSGNGIYHIAAGQVLVGAGSASGNTTLTTEPPFSTASPIQPNTNGSTTPTTTTSGTGTTTPTTTSGTTTTTPAPATTSTVNVGSNYYGTISNATIQQTNTTSAYIGLTGSNDSLFIAGATDRIAVTGNNNAVKITANAGTNEVDIAGNNNVVDAGFGWNTLKDNGGTGNTFVLHGNAGIKQDLYGSLLTNNDVLDVRNVLGATDWNGSASTVSSYISVKQAANGADASLLVSKTAGGAGVAFATLHNVGTLTEATLLPQLKVS